jgi:predicted nucleic acid-binding protein
VTSCLDAWAVLAWLDGEEPAAGIVQGALDAERPTISWVNLVEIEYQVRRHHGAHDAEAVLGRLRELVDAELPGVARMRAVAALKAEHPIALADCFAIATAAAENATLITGDPEILDRADQIPCAVRDARAFS